MICMVAVANGFWFDMGKNVLVAGEWVERKKRDLKLGSSKPRNSKRRGTREVEGGFEREEGWES